MVAAVANSCTSVPSGEPHVRSAFADTLQLLHIRAPHCSFRSEGSLCPGTSQSGMSTPGSSTSVRPSLCPITGAKTLSELLYRRRFFLPNPIFFPFCLHSCQNCSVVFPLSFSPVFCTDIPSSHNKKFGYLIPSGHQLFLEDSNPWSGYVKDSKWIYFSNCKQV